MSEASREEGYLNFHTANHNNYEWWKYGVGYSWDLINNSQHGCLCGTEQVPVDYHWVQGFPTKFPQWAGHSVSTQTSLSFNWPQEKNL